MFRFLLNILFYTTPFIMINGTLNATSNILHISNISDYGITEHLHIPAWGLNLICITLLLCLMLVSLLLINKKRERIRYKKFMSFLDKMPDTAIIYDKNCRIIDIINPQDSVFRGVEWQKLIGLTIEEYSEFYNAPEEDLKILKENILNAVNKGKTSTVVFRYYLGNKTYYVKTRTVPFDKNTIICFGHDITENVKSERELNRMKSFLQSTVKNLPVGMFIKDADNDFRYLFCNDKLYSFYQASTENRIGKNDFEINDPLATTYLEEDKMIIEKGQVLSFERQRCNPETGEIIKWGITTKSSFTDDTGHKYLIGIVTDNTKYRKNEIARENIKRQLAVALEAGSLSAWSYNIDKKKFVSLYRHSVEGHSKTLENLLTVVHPEDKENLKDFIEKLQVGKGDKSKGIFRFMENGEYQWYESHAIGLSLADPNKINYIVGIEKNISNEMKLKREYEDNKAKLEFTLSAANIFPWEFNIENSSFVFPKSNLIGKTLVNLDDYLNFINKEDSIIFQKGLQDLISGKTNKMDLQLRVELDSGELHWIEMHAVPYRRDGKEKINKIIGIRRDITNLKMTNELIELRDKAEESNRLKSAFLANMSHEIRTPLNAIVGFSNLLSETQDKEEIKEYAKIIEDNNDILLQLINDILDLSKIEAGLFDFTYFEIDIKDIFSYLEQTFRYRIKSGVNLIINLPEESTKIVSDRHRLIQVLTNFISNSCKYTSSGYIETGYTIKKDLIRFYVKDSGKGIAKENVPHVFERFSKFDPFIQGTGLGLSICSSIVQSFDGEIGCESELGEGSEFWFTIPLQSKNKPDTVMYK